MGGPLDKLGAVIKRDDHDTLGQADFDFFHSLFNPFDNFQRIFPVTDNHDAAYGFFSVFIQRSPPEFRAGLDRGNTFQENRRPLAGADNDIFDIFQILDKPRAADNKFHAAAFKHFGAHIDIRPAHRVEQIAQP